MRIDAVLFLWLAVGLRRYATYEANEIGKENLSCMFAQGLWQKRSRIVASGSCALRTRVVSFLATGSVRERRKWIWAAGLLLLTMAVSGYSQSTGPSLPPVVTSIVPAGEYRGGTTAIRFIGKNLDGATFSFNGTGVSGGWNQSTGNWEVTVAPDGPLGPQQVTVSTPSGTTTSCGAGPCLFQVIDSGTWQDLNGSPLQERPQAIIRLLDERVLFVGNLALFAGDHTAHTFSWIFDPASGQWTNPTPLPESFSSSLPGILLADGRALVIDVEGLVQIFDPASGTWTIAGTTTPGTPMLLADGSVLLQKGGIGVFSGTLFDPVTGTSRPTAGTPLPNDSSRVIQPLADGRLLLIGNIDNKIYSPATGAFTTLPLMATLSGGWTRILPDGRILVRTYQNFGRVTPPVQSFVYDPQTNSVVRVSSFDNLNNVGSGFGEDILLPSGQLLINGTFGAYSPVSSFTLSQPILYDASKDAIFPQLPVPGSILMLTTLLADGRVLGFGNTWNGKTGLQIYTPAAFQNPAPVISYINSTPADSSAGITRLEIHGSGFTPNTSVFAGQSRLVTLYFGSTELVAFVPSTLQASIASGIVLNNAAPGGGSTLPIRPGVTATAPLPINDVETGAIRTGYVVLATGANNAAPVATLTYGIVHNAVVQSQASILPAGSVLDTSISVDVVPAAARNLGVAIANVNPSAATISLKLRDASGTTISTIALALPAKGQIARFVTELLGSSVVGAAFHGSLEIQSSLPVSVIGLQFSGQVFSTVPIPGASPPGAMIVFPQFAMSGGWATTLSLLNNTSGVIAGRIDIFDTAGNPMTITLNGTEASTFTYSIPAQGNLLFAPRDSNGQSPF